MQTSQKDSKKQEDKIFQLKKVLGQLKNENVKVIKTKNILKIHSKQRQFIQKYNEQFFGKEIDWIKKKVDFYN